MKKLPIKITSLAKYFAGAERNDEVENELKALTVCAHVRGWKRLTTVRIVKFFCLFVMLID